MLYEYISTLYEYIELRNRDFEVEHANMKQTVVLLKLAHIAC